MGVEPDEPHISLMTGTVPDRVQLSAHVYVNEDDQRIPKGIKMKADGTPQILFWILGPDKARYSWGR